MPNPFFINHGPYDILEILNLLNLNSNNFQKRKVHDVKDLLNASNNDLTFFHSKRYKDIAIKQPKIHFVKTGFFDYWLKSKGKLGGQNKIPRLSNDRKYLDSMLEHISLFQ